MSTRLRIIVSNLTVIVVLSALSITVGFLLFWFAASLYMGDRFGENIASIAARYFSFGGIATLIISGIGALCVISVTARRVSAPLKKLYRAAMEIRDGNLGYELPVSGHDEFAELAAGFEQMRVRLKDSMRTQEKIEIERRTMMASITHDLKTPITSIMGYAEGILDGVAYTPEKIREYALVICKKAQSLQLLAEDLSLLSRLDNAQLPLDKQDEDFAELVSEVAAEFTHDNQDLCLTSQLASGFHVMIDREKMARVLRNLFQNSIKYKNPDIFGLKISLAIVKYNGDALFTMSDNGIGIASGDLPHVFDWFYQADTSRGQQPGSGLGLTIARQLVQLHDGKIWIINNPGGGISVNITLPLIREPGNS